MIDIQELQKKALCDMTAEERSFLAELLLGKAAAPVGDNVEIINETSMNPVSISKNQKYERLAQDTVKCQHPISVLSPQCIEGYPYVLCRNCCISFIPDVYPFGPAR